MPRITHRDFSKGLWLSGPRDTIPSGALRQATGIRNFTGTSVKSRWGSRLAISKANIHSLIRFNGKRYAGSVSDFGVVAANTAITSVLAGRLLTGRKLHFAKGIPSIDTDRTAFPQGPEHLFVVGGGLTIVDRQDTAASGTGIFKLSTTNEVSVLGITPPIIYPTCRKVDSQGTAKPIDSFDTPAGNAAWIHDPALDPPLINTNTTFRQLGSGAMFFGLGAAQLASIVKTLSPVQDLFHASPQADSSPQDWIQLFVLCDQPKNLDFINIWFDTTPDAEGVNTKDIFSYEITVEDAILGSQPTGIGDNPAFFDDQPKLTPEQQRKQFNKQADQKKKIAKSLVPIDAGKVIVSALGTTKIAKSDNTWTLLRIPKQDFHIAGHADWSHVRGMRITVSTNTNGPVQLLFDALSLHIGTGMMGTYKYAYRYRNKRTGTKSNPCPVLDNNPVTTVKDVQRDPVALAGLQRGTDPQVDTIDIFRTVGNGDELFKIDEIPATQPVYTDIVADARLLQDPDIRSSFGSTINTPGRLTKYIEAESLEFDNARFPGSLKDIAGPHYNRMFALDGKIGERGKLLFSPVGRLEANEGFIEVTTDDDPLHRVLVWSNNIYVFSTKLWEVQGEDTFIATEIQGAPGTNLPETVVPTDVGIFYQANDGVRVFDGAGSRLVFPEAVMQYFRGEGLADPYNATTARFEGTSAAYRDDEYYISNAEVTFALNIRTGAWRNVGVAATAMFTEPAELAGGTAHQSRLLLATAAAAYEWEVPGLLNDAGAAIPFLIETPGTLVEDQSGTTKLVQRLYLDLNGGPVNVRVRFTAPGGLVDLGAVNVGARQRIEFALGLPSDVISVEISGDLIQPFELFEQSFDCHLPEEPGALT